MIRCPGFCALVSLVLVVPAGRASAAARAAEGRHPVTASGSGDAAADPGEPQGGDIVGIEHPHHRRERREADERPPTAGEKAAADQEQYDSRRIQVFLVPIGDAASLAAGKAQVALEGEVSKLPGFHPVDLVKELAVPPSERDQRQLAEALRVESDGNQQLAQHAYDEAANRYRKAVRLLAKSGNALTAATWADAWTRVAIALRLTGEDAGSKDAFRRAARADLANVVDGRRIDPRLGAGLDSARDEVRRGPDGALSVVTSPPGARVFLGGVYKGSTPLTIEHVAAGQNFVRLDRPGAIAVVRLVDVKDADDTPLRVPMQFTQEAQRLQQTLVQVPDALSHEAGIPDMLKALGRRFRLERAVFATVEMVRTGTAQLRMVVVDFDRQTRLADEKQTFNVDAESGVDAAMSRWARHVLDDADHSRNRAASDPLDRFDGTEGWYKSKPPPRQDDDPDAPAWDQHHYKPAPVLKPGKGADPLDSENGTDDW